jgi:hypothetical protein
MPIDDALEELKDVPENVLRETLEKNGTLVYKITIDKEIENPQGVMKKYLEEQRVVEKLLLGKVRKATVEDYKNWLQGYAKKTKMLHSVDLPFISYNMYVATEDFEIAPLHNEYAIKIIVPEGIKCKGNLSALGDNKLFLEEDYITNMIFPEEYSNTRVSF